MFFFSLFVLDLICLHFTLFCSSPYLFLPIQNQKFLYSFFTTKFSRPFLLSLLRCLISCFSFLLESSCFSLFFPFSLIFRVSWCYFSWFVFINLLFGSLQNLFVFEKFQKISLIQLLVFPFLVVNCSRTFFMHDTKNTLLCFQSLFWKISCFLISSYLFAKKVTSKKYLILLIFLFTFSSSFVFYFCVLSFCLLSLSLLFFFLFFLHASSPFVCSLHVYLLSLMFLLFVFIPIFRFFETLLFNFRFLLKSHSFFELFISLCETFLVVSFFLFRLFFWLFFFFRCCSFEQDQVYLWKQKPLGLTNPAKNFVSDFLWLDIVWKSSIIIFFLKKNFSKKNLNFLKFLENPFFFKKVEQTCFTTKVAVATNIFGQISFCGNLFVFRKISVSPAFSEKVCLYHIFLFFIYNNFSQKSLSKILFSEKKKKLLFIYSWFFFLRKSFLFFNCLVHFCLRLLCFSFSVLFFCWFHLFFQFVQPKNSLLKIFRENMGLLNFFFLNFFGSESTLIKKRGAKQKLSFEFNFKSFFF